MRLTTPARRLSSVINGELPPTLNAHVPEDYFRHWNEQVKEFLGHNATPPRPLDLSLWRPFLFRLWSPVLCYFGRDVGIKQTTDSARNIILRRKSHFQALEPANKLAFLRFY